MRTKALILALALQAAPALPAFAQDWQSMRRRLCVDRQEYGHVRTRAAAAEAAAANQLKRRPMHLALIILAVILLAPIPALAQGACPNTCPEGYVRDAGSGECVPIALMV